MSSAGVLPLTGMTAIWRFWRSGATSTTAKIASISFFCSSVAVTSRRLLALSATTDGLGWSSKRRSDMRSLIRLLRLVNAVSSRALRSARICKDRCKGRDFSARRLRTISSIRVRCSPEAVTMSRLVFGSAMILAWAAPPVLPSATSLR